MHDTKYNIRSTSCITHYKQSQYSVCNAGHLEYPICYVCQRTL